VTPAPLVLASRSPRRREALAALGLSFETVVSDVESRLGPLPDPTDPLPVATAKALDVLASRPDAVVIGGDTIVDLQGQALGKPDGAAEATAMLRRLRGRRHAVRSAVAVATAGPRPAALASAATPPAALASAATPPAAEGAALHSCEVAAPVRMRDYDHLEVERYVASGEPLDCAGAYDVHRLGGALVLAVEGCLSAVVGLPLVVAAALLRDAGVDVPQGPARTCSRLYGRPCLAERQETAWRCEPARLSRQVRPPA
jgi:septum formation protein